MLQGIEVYIQFQNRSSYYEIKNSLDYEKFLVNKYIQKLYTTQKCLIGYEHFNKIQISASPKSVIELNQNVTK